MTEPPDMTELAKRYLDLWQEHLTLTASDPVMIDAFSRIMQAMPTLFHPGALTPGGSFGWPQNPEHGSGPDQQTDQTQTRTAAAAAASGDGAGVYELLNRRLARIEERITDLECKLADPDRPASGRTKRR